MKTIKITISALTVLFTVGVLLSQEVDYNAMLKRYFSQKGMRCNKCGDLSSTSYTCKFRNEGKEVIDVKVALQKENSKWETFTFNAVAPNDSIQMCICKGTSKSLKWVRKAGDVDTVFPTDAEINNDY